MNKISLFSLVLLIVAAIDSIRNLPTTAFFGGSLIFYCLLSAAFFLIPVSLISAEFSSRYPNEGGVFHWIRFAFGERSGVFAVWLQWINTMVWYPGMLLFIAGTTAHLLNPALAESKTFLVSTTLGIFWGLTFINLKGIQVSARMNSFCGCIGTLFPMFFLIFLGAGWLLFGNASAITFSSLIPSLDILKNGGALISIMASFLGMELAGVHINDIQNPQKNFPKAIGYSVFILMATLVFGSLSIAIVMPNQDIHFIDGIMQTFTTFFNAFHMPFLIPVLAALIIIGSIGGSINWLLSPAKGLLQAAEYNFLPRFFLVKNRYNVSVRILFMQAIIVSFLCLTINLLPSVNAFYWFLMSLSTALYMLMYIMLFLAALKLGRPKDSQSYQIPRGLRRLSCFSGMIGCVLTILIGFQPTSNANIENRLHYAILIAAGLVIMTAPVILLWIYNKKQKAAGTVVKATRPTI